MQFLNLEVIKKNVSDALAEDVGSGDATALLIAESSVASAEIISREPMIVCGIPWVNETFFQIDPNIHIAWLVKEGESLTEPKTLCSITGNARHVLTAERTALNFLQTLSATATATHQYLTLLRGFHTRLLDTRKTLPGLRYAQKYAVQCAGGTNHRMGLYDAYLIKENHIASCGSIQKAILHARACNPSLFLEVEVENLDEFQQALAMQPDRILLDNFTTEQLVLAVKMNTKIQCELEASGNVTLDTIQQIASTGVDYISVGGITKSIQAIDLSLLVRAIV